MDCISVRSVTYCIKKNIGHRNVKNGVEKEDHAILRSLSMQ